MRSPTQVVLAFEVRSPADGSVNKYFSPLTLEQVNRKTGLRVEAILGWLKDPRAEVNPDNFVENAAYIRFLHETIGKYFEQCPSLAAEAHRVANGFVYILDGRTPRQTDRQLPAEDLIGIVEVREGDLSEYRPADGYRLLTTSGFPVLEPWLHERLIEELMALPVIYPAAARPDPA